MTERFAVRAAPHNGRSRRWKSLLFTPAVLLAGCATNPVSGNRDFVLMSEAQEIQMGKDADADLQKQLPIDKAAAPAARVEATGAALTTRSERPALPWTYRVLDDSALNAFAVPGGHLYITRGLYTHMEDEAELAAVLGHETGHVTARHGVKAVTRAQVGQLSLALGSLLSERVARNQDLLGVGFGLLMLRYSRDQERQADELGFRYAREAGYDPAAAQRVFALLERASKREGGRLPGFLATHPDPGDRKATAAARVAALPENERTGHTEAAAFLRSLDGVTFGDNPRHGYFKGSRFKHPDMAFRWDTPEGWKAVNGVAAVLATPEGRKGGVRLRIADRAGAGAALDAFFTQQGVMRTGDFRPRLAVSGQGAYFSAAGESSSVRGVVLYVEHGGRTFELLGLASDGDWSALRGDLEASLQSFAPLTEQAALNVKPWTLRVTTLAKAMDVESCRARYAPLLGMEEFLLLNRIEPGATLEKGRSVKSVSGDPVP